MQMEFVKIPAVYMRGGTSKGVYLMEKDLPSDPAARDRVILDIYGSPDVRQINGMGGADPLTSKVALLSPSRRPGVDIDYTFGYVGIKEAVVDYEGNCGNISSGVGVYAIRQGLVKAVEPVTKVVIFNTNTSKIIEALIPVRDGEVTFEGDYTIAGVPGKGARIVMNFPNSAGSKTGRLLPTGNVQDTMALNDGRSIRVSLVDAANPSVFVRASDIGLTGKELPEDCERNPSILSIMEEIRVAAGVMMGLAKNKDKVGPAVPKVAFVAPAQDYVSSEGSLIGSDEVDLLARTKAMAQMHKTYAVTGGICIATAARIEGTVVNEIASARAKATGEVRVGHPSGVLEVFVGIERSENGGWNLLQAGVCRTARPIMDGEVYVSRKAYLSP
ncbi:2-methylaconitate cis-trans isomerase PrpF family protein [Propionivibrio soli]|uniref:2-methylaconitate cis-trans isomerase PrpF family protein n=1 Tax=Propionivibrio soli TaxID=2976531 RepID=UPI0021E8024F|nr:PrpF domain-containing protein [Propionivibrio soli]